MDNKKITIWLLGSNASGKTTQAKLLHQLERNPKPRFREYNTSGQKLCYTEFGQNLVCNIGYVKDNQCTGTDSLGSRYQIENSYYKALQSPNKIIIVDGIMATSRWADFLVNDKSKLFVVLLHFDSLVDNLKRIQDRRAAKENGVIRPIEEKTMKNIQGKIKGFKSMFDNVSNKADHSIQINASFDKNDIHGLICEELNKLI